MSGPTGDLELTVIVPVFNRDESLRRAVASVTSQPDRVSVVIVDDGSGPEFAAAADALALAGRPLVQVVHQMNLGPAAARNRGLNVTDSRFVMFLDSDDELAETACASIKGCLAGHDDVGMICGSVRVTYPDGSSRTDYPTVVPGVPWGKLVIGRAGGFVVRTDIAQAVGGYDEALRFAENTDLILRIADECRKRSLQICATDDVFAISYAAWDERRYDAERLDAALHLLRRGRFDLDLPSERAKLHGIASVNAGRMRRYGLSVKHGALAALAEPRNPRHLIRLAFSLCGPLARRRWLRA